MKLHLPICLYRALMALVAAPLFVSQAFANYPVTLPDNVEEYTKVSHLFNLGDNAEDARFLYILGFGVGYGASSNWEGREHFIKNGTFFIASENHPLSPHSASFGSEARVQKSVFLDCKEVVFDYLSNLSVRSISGSAINMEHGDFIVRHVNDGTLETDDVIFTKNSGNAKGGAILACNAEFFKNGDIRFSENTITAANVANGAAIFAENLKMDSNEGVFFCDNSAVIDTLAHGGAVYALNGVTLNHNGTVTFSGNQLTSNSIADGGAIYTIYDGLLMDDNVSVLFSGNKVSGNSANGGAIDSVYGDIVLSNNDVITFRGNVVSGGSTACGGAIYSYSGDVRIVGNGDVLFEKNIEKKGDAYRLRSVYVEDADVELSARSNSSITFNDSLYIGSGNSVKINSTYTDEEGETQEATGAVIISGEHTKEHLDTIIAADTEGKINPRLMATAEELDLSRSSEINSPISLEGGSFRITKGAVLSAATLTTLSNSNASLVIQDASASFSGVVTINGGSALIFADGGTLSASKVELKNDGILGFTLSSSSDNETIGRISNAELSIGDRLTIRIDGTIEEGKEYSLFSYDGGAGDFRFPEDCVVTVQDGSTADINPLSIQNGALTYVGRPVLECATWSNQSGDFKWNASSVNWSENGVNFSYMDGVEVVFTDTGAGRITLEGTLAPESVRVNSSADYVFAGEGKLSGEMTLTKEGSGTLTLETANEYSGGTIISGGKLVVGNASALGSGQVKLRDTALEITANEVTNSISASGVSSLLIADGFTYTPGSGIMAEGTFTIDGCVHVANMSATNPGVGIRMTTADSKLIIQGADDSDDTTVDLSFADNESQSSEAFYGAVMSVSDSITLEANGTVEMTGNRGWSEQYTPDSKSDIISEQGGGVLKTEALIIKSNGKFVAEDNSVENQLWQAWIEDRYVQHFNMKRDASGGAMYTANAAFSHNGEVSLRGNSAQTTMEMVDLLLNQGDFSYRESIGSQGGALYAKEYIRMEENGSITLSGNYTANTYTYTRYINNLNQTSITAIGIESHSNGGALYAGGGLTLQNNQGDMVLSENYCLDSSAAMVNTYGNPTISISRSALGGAVYTAGETLFSGNKNISLLDNDAITDGSEESFRLEKATQMDMTSCGGGIYATESLSFLSNGDILLRGNSVSVLSNENSADTLRVKAAGGAIYSTGSITFSGNGNVTFEKNYERLNDALRLRSIYMAPDSADDKLMLNAPAGKQIVFYDTVYMGEYAGASVILNDEYKGADGEIQRSGGDIVFSGEFAKSHLEDIIAANTAVGETPRKASEAEILNSQTSEIYNPIVLKGGSMQVVDGATLKGKGISLAENSGATLLLRHAALNHADSVLTFAAGTRLQLQGVSTISANLCMSEGSTLSFLPGEEQCTNSANATAQLTLSGTLQFGDGIILNITGSLTKGETYKLLTWENGSMPSNWSFDTVTVTGNPDADFSSLTWVGDTLYYEARPTLEIATWNDSEGNGCWNASSVNWVQEGVDYLYKDGVAVVFGDAGAGDVKLVGTLKPGRVEVDTDKDYTFSGDGQLSGSMMLTKKGSGTLTVNTANDYSGITELLGGTLVIGNEKALGTGAIFTAGDSTLQTGADVTLALEEAISNSGNLTLKGSFDASALRPVLTGVTVRIDADGKEGGASGFLRADDFSVTVVNGGHTDSSGARVLYGEQTLSMVGGIGYGEGDFVDYSDYLLSEGDTVAYSKVAEAAGDRLRRISLNGGSLKMDADTGAGLSVISGGSVEIAEHVMLQKSRLRGTADEKKVHFSGTGGYDLQGSLDAGEGVVFADSWTGTVYTGALGSAEIEQLDVNHLGNESSTVWLGAAPMARSAGADVQVGNLSANHIGTTIVPGALRLNSRHSVTQNLVVHGPLTLGSAESAVTLSVNGSLTPGGGLILGHVKSSVSAITLNSEALNVVAGNEVLQALTGGNNTTVLTLGNPYNGSVTLNGGKSTEILSADGKTIYTLDWEGLALVLSAEEVKAPVDDDKPEGIKPLPPLADTPELTAQSVNGRAGAALLNDAFRTPVEAGGSLAVLQAAARNNTLTERDLSAVSGASVAVLGQAFSSDIERRLNAIRNRAESGNDGSTCEIADEKSGLVSMMSPTRFFAWVNAEGNRAEQNADGGAAGYTMNSWGGTLGAGMTVNNQFTMGLALTAMYGDLESDAADYLEGDMDTYYLSAFARYNQGAWNHCFIGTVGTMESDYRRTVNHSAGSYGTAGDTEGSAFGIMYELSRDFALNRESSLSPMFNISYRHTGVDAYSERGADAALNVGSQSLDTVTAGLGARYAAELGQNTFNRACAAEARILVKYDMGDTQSDSSVGFMNHASRARIESAEQGAWGVELGVGISVPMGNGSIFADGSVELRSDYTNYNATLGYRIQF